MAGCVEVPEQKERRTTNEESQKNRKRRTHMQVVEVRWEDINKLDIGSLQNMGEDGYLFEISDGKIRNILMTVASPV